MNTLILRSTLIWLGLFVLAFVNGAFREGVMKNLLRVNKRAAHRLSCLTGAILWTVFVWFTWARMPIVSLVDAGMVGAYWCALTVLVETGLINRLMSKMTWRQILHPYNVVAGEWWLLVLLWLGILPVVIFWFKES